MMDFEFKIRFLVFLLISWTATDTARATIERKSHLLCRFLIYGLVFLIRIVLGWFSVHTNVQCVPGALSEPSPCQRCICVPFNARICSLNPAGITTNNNCSPLTTKKPIININNETTPTSGTTLYPILLPKSVR
jgi:hypothetical protein